MKHTLPLLAALLAPLTPLFAEGAPFRPEPGKFPPLPSSPTVWFVIMVLQPIFGIFRSEP